MKRGRALLILALALVPNRAEAQVRLWVDALGSTASPPADVAGRDASTYGLAGLRLERTTAQSFAELMLHAGAGARRQDGRWLNAGVLGSRQWSLGRSALGVTGDGFLLQYSEPFRYTAGSVGLKPELVTGIGPVDVELFGTASAGRWSTRYTIEPGFPPTGRPVAADTTIDGDLRLIGFGTGAGFEIRSAVLRIGASSTHAVNGSADGWYRMAEASVLTTRGPFQAHAASQLQRYDGETEFGFSIAVQRELFDNVQAHASLMRAVRDPQLATPAHVGFTLGFSVPLLAGPTFRGTLTPIAEVLGSAQGGRRVRFSVRAPATARVQLVGSFTNWQPTAMKKSGEHWTAELPVPAGSHQFAFLLDGRTWFVPDDAPGVVDDGFGRRNATLVVAR